MARYIEHPYTAQRGTINGLPFLHVAVNIAPYDYAQQATEDFIDDYGFRVCVDDYNSDAARGPLQTNAVHDLFQPPFLKPVMLIINGIADSPTHAAWALTLNRGGAPLDWAAAITQWRAALDVVEAPPPRMAGAAHVNGLFQFTFQGQRGRTNRVESTADFVTWTAITNVTGTNAAITFREREASPASQQYFRVRRL